MSSKVGLWKRLARHYRVWRLYHCFVADAVSIQRVTKHKLVHDFLGDTLGIAADIGCGPGVFVRHMSARARFLVEIDVDRDSLERTWARHQDLRNVVFAISSVQALPFTEGHLDTILFLEVLEHITDDRAALREIHRVLRPNGRLILSVPVPPGEVNEGEEWGHKREGYQLHEITAVLADSSFEVQKFAFAEFRFSRRATKVVRWWRRTTHLPAPIFFSWIAYLDHLLDSSKEVTGVHLPTTVLLLARKKQISE